MLRSLRSIDSTKQKKMPRGNRSILLTDTQRLWYLSTQRKLHLVHNKRLARTLSRTAAVGRYVYLGGTTGPANDIYKISQFLEISSTKSVRRSKTRAEMWEYLRSESQFDADDILYEFVKIKADYQGFELSDRQISDRQKSPFTDTLTMHEDWTGG